MSRFIRHRVTDSEGDFSAKKLTRGAVVCAVMFMVLAGIAGCGERKPKQTDLIAGNWTYYRSRTYTLISMDLKGTWTSSVRIADATTKIVGARGKAGGTWHLDEGQLIFNVEASDIEKVWEKNDTRFYKVLALSKHLMVLESEKGRKEEWKKAVREKKADSGTVNPVVTMAPYAVNLNKNSSNIKDRYLCLNMHLELMELMPDRSLPQFHPRARDAAIMYLSSLTYDDVSDFDRVKAQKEKIKNVLNPYMEGLIKEVIIDHVVINASITKVEEFIIENTVESGSEEPAEGEEAETSEEGAQKDNPDAS